MEAACWEHPWSMKIPGLWQGVGQGTGGKVGPRRARGGWWIDDWGGGAAICKACTYLSVLVSCLYRSCCQMLVQNWTLLLPNLGPCSLCPFCTLMHWFSRSGIVFLSVDVNGQWQYFLPLKIMSWKSEHKVWTHSPLFEYILTSHRRHQD